MKNATRFFNAISITEKGSDDRSEIIDVFQHTIGTVFLLEDKESNITIFKDGSSLIFFFIDSDVNDVTYESESEEEFIDLVWDYMKNSSNPNENRLYQMIENKLKFEETFQKIQEMESIKMEYLKKGIQQKQQQKQH